MLLFSIHQNTMAKMILFKNERKTSMKSLTDELLIKTYLQAIKLKLDPSFIQQLENELKRRRLIIIKKE